MKSAKCLACGFVGRSDLEFCKACGAPFSQSAAYAPHPSAGYASWDEPESEKKAMAIASLVIGILSFLTFGFFGVGAILGIVLGIMAMKRVKNEPWRYGGRGIAIAGLVLSICSLLVVIPVGMIAAIAIPNLLQSRMAANEGAAIHSLRTITAAEMTYQAQYQKYGTLEELGDVHLIDPVLASGTKSGYRFAVELSSEAPTELSGANAEGFVVTGVPVDYRHSGMRSFYVDATAVVRGDDKVGMPASATDPPLETRPLRAGRQRF